MNDPYHVYMDLDVINNDYNATRKPQLRFEETRNTPSPPGDSADYFCSIVRLNIQTGSRLPVFIPKIQTGRNDINKTIYQVAIIYDFLRRSKYHVGLSWFCKRNVRSRRPNHSYTSTTNHVARFK